MLSIYEMPHFTRQEILAGWRQILACLGFPPTWCGLRQFARLYGERERQLDRTLAFKFERRLLDSADGADLLCLFRDATIHVVPTAIKHAKPLLGDFGGVDRAKLQQAFDKFEAASYEPFNDGYRGVMGVNQFMGRSCFVPLVSGSSWKPGPFRDGKGIMRTADWWAKYLN